MTATAAPSHPPGRPPETCCVGLPWETASIHDICWWGEPLPQPVIDIAAEYGLDPHLLDWHVEAEHGWEPHDTGYDDAVRQAADCLTELAAYTR